MIYNLWVSASGPMKTDLKRWVNGDYNYPTDDVGDIDGPYNPLTFEEILDMSGYTEDVFRGFLQSDTTENFLEEWDAQGRTYKVWSVYSAKPAHTPQVRADLDMLAAAWPLDFSIMGAWDWDGDQVGNPPWYPIPPQLINFMPSGVLEDVHLLVGQGPRDFTS